MLVVVLTRYEIAGQLAIAIFFTVVASLLLCLCGRITRFTFLAPTFLFALLFGVYLIIGNLPVNLPGLIYLASMSGTIAIFNVALATLLILGWLAIKRAGIGDLRYPLRLLLVLNVCFLSSTNLWCFIWRSSIPNFVWLRRSSLPSRYLAKPFSRGTQSPT